MRSQVDGELVHMESDPALFEMLTQRWAPRGGVEPSQIHLDVSSRCNLSCPLCYDPGADGREEMSLARIRHEAERYHGRSFILGGREPTMRRDLPDIVRAIRPHGSTMLLTNGVKLADAEHLQALMDAGLDGVILSLNGLTDGPHVRLNGKGLLATKLEALGNLERLDVPTVVSMTLMPGVNTDQVGPVLALCQKRAGFIRELRIRAARPVGRAPAEAEEQLHMSDLLSFVATQGNMERESILRGLRLWHGIGRELGIDAYRPRLCTTTFMIRKHEGRWKPEGELLGDLEPATSIFPRLRLLDASLRLYGPRPVLRRLLSSALPGPGGANHRTQIEATRGCTDLMQITLKSWPDPRLFLEGERCKCTTLLVSGNSRVRFCEKNVCPA